MQPGDQKVPRVLSGFIRQMSEEDLLIPEESVDLKSIIGQGERSFYERVSVGRREELMDC